MPGLAIALENNALDRVIQQSFGVKSGALFVLDGATGSNRYEWGSGSLRHYPGSSIKPLVLAYALSSRLVQPQMRYLCPVKLTVGGHNLTCTHPRSAGGIDGATAIAYSCNNYFVELSRRMPAGSVSKAFRSYRLSDIAVPPSADQAALQAIGLWGVRVSPRELAAAYSEIAKANDATVVSGLRAAVEYGTAQRARLTAVPLAAKTGTSEGGWIAGFTPKFSFALYVEHGNGPGDAAPIARQALAAILKVMP